MTRIENKNYDRGYFPGLENWEIRNAEFYFDDEEWILQAIEDITINFANGYYALSQNAIEALCNEDWFRSLLEGDILETWTP